MPVIPACEKYGLGNQVLKAILGYVVNLRPAWAVLNPRKNKVTCSKLVIKTKNWCLCNT